MSVEQKKKITVALVDFIERVAHGNTTSETEIEALPEVVNALINLNNTN